MIRTSTKHIALTLTFAFVILFMNSTFVSPIASADDEEMKVKASLAQIVNEHGSQFQSDQTLLTLHRHHPRLFITDSDMEKVRSSLKSEKFAQDVYKRLTKQAQDMLREPTVEQTEIPGEGMLRSFRGALKRITTLAGLYRIDRNPAYLSRARLELLKACSLPDWNPSHFLDTAEMSNAVGLGYDWLYNDLSESDRATIERGLIKNGINPALQQYSSKPGWWATVHHNWNLVCNGGMVVGALAIADIYPEGASKVLRCARLSAPLAMATFAPDGGWPEGPGYWAYATKYVAFMLGALQTALGTDWGFRDAPGFADTGYFRMNARGPFNIPFNFADAVRSVEAAPQMFWLGREFKRPVYAQDEAVVAMLHTDVFHLLLAPDSGLFDAPAQSIPTDKLFHGTKVGFFRSQWSDPDAVYLAIKGGDNNTNHAHLDLGTFVFDCDGVRWAEDIGGADYGLPKYFGSLRWNYYHTSTQGHNTLSVDNQNQDPKASARIVEFIPASKLGKFAIVDLTNAYRGSLTSALRGFALNGRRLLVQDEIDSDRPTDLAWHLHTFNEVAVSENGKEALMNGAGAKKITMNVSFLEAADGTFTAETPNIIPPEKGPAHLTDLIGHIHLRPGHNRVAILIAPADEPDAKTNIVPLSNWHEHH